MLDGSVFFFTMVCAVTVAAAHAATASSINCTSSALRLTTYVAVTSVAVVFADVYREEGNRERERERERESISLFCCGFGI